MSFVNASINLSSRMRLKLIVTFCLSLFFKQILAQDESFNYEVDPSTVHDSVDINAKYIDGDLALLKFVAENTQYPSICKENGISGVVYVTFVVDVDGKVKDARVVRKADPNLDAEALRVVRSLKDFKPGEHKGVKVPVSQTIPIRFKLNSKQAENAESLNVNSQSTLPERLPYKKQERPWFLPQFPGGDSALYAFIADSTIYPAIAIENGITGTVNCRLTIDEMGFVRNVFVTSNADPFLEKAAVNVLERLPQFTTSTYPSEFVASIKFWLTEGEPVGEYYTVDKHIELTRFDFTNTERNDYYLSVEKMPEYPGGDMAMLKFLAENTEYPFNAKQSGITGVVYVSYIVDLDGAVKDVKVVKGAHPLLDAEAIRVVSLLKGYTPGTQDGKPVPVQFTVPLRFVLHGQSRSTPLLNYEAKAAYDSAKTFMSEGDFSEAIKLYSRSISLEPTNYVPYYERAIARYANEQFTQAEMDFAQVLKLTDNEHFNTYLYRGMMRYENGQTEFAIEDLTKAIGLDKKAIEPYIERAKCFSVSGDFKSARKDLQKSLRIDPKNFDAILDLGIIIYTEGNFDKALVQFQEAIGVQPSAGSAYYFAGMCYARLRNMSMACENLIKAKALGYKEAIPLVDSQCSGK